MLKIFVSQNVKISDLQLFYWGIKIYANTLFSTSSTSKIILCIQLKIDHFKLTTHTLYTRQYSQSVSILFIYANIFSNTGLHQRGHQRSKENLLSNSVQQFREDEIFVPSCCTKKMIFFLIFCIKYLIFTHSTQ